MAKASKNYLKMHHPSLYKKMYGKGGKVKKEYAGGGSVHRKRYAGGGQVNKAKALQGMGDVVDAKLTPGEIVLNADQQTALEQELGQPIDGLMAKIGVPGFEGGGKVKVSKGTVASTGRSVFNTETIKKDGKTRYKRTEAHQVHTPEGKRWYKGEGTSSRMGIASSKAKMKALAAYVSTPSDSLVAGGKDPMLTTKKKPKKKKFWQK